MKVPIRIKSSPSGLRIILEETCNILEIQEALTDKMAESRKFFKDAWIAITFEGKQLSEEEENLLCDIITTHSDLNIICVVKENAMEEEYFQRAIRIVADEKEKSDICFVRQSVINDDIVESKKDVVILGDVHPGCTVISDKNIYVYGGLYGEAYANGHIIALEMAPEEMKIGDVHYLPAKKYHWGIKPKLVPKIAFVSNDKINIEPFTKELLSRLL
ncbi:MAG TPA: septum site-determining protein MinC [Lachnospiraceae bacterium]|nr:septum site-determining protein MinC [Lachnospiraceae bacterium]